VRQTSKSRSRARSSVDKLLESEYVNRYTVLETKGPRVRESIRKSRAKQARERWLQIDSEIRQCTYRRK